LTTRRARSAAACSRARARTHARARRTRKRRTFAAEIMTTMKPPAALSLTPALSRLSSSFSTLPPQMSLTAEASHARFCATRALKAAT